MAARHRRGFSSNSNELSVFTRRLAAASPCDPAVSAKNTSSLPDRSTVDIPYRSLIVRDAANVLVAGRCFSATHDAHASVRSMAQCMAMGQAVGTAAALATSMRGDPRAVKPDDLRHRLRRAGAILELTRPEAVAR